MLKEAIKSKDQLDNRKLYRNYTSDEVGMRRDIMNLICKCFDEHQEDSSGVEYKVMFSYVMKHSKGHFNPIIVEEMINLI